MSDYKKYHSETVVGQYYDWVAAGNPAGGYRTVSLDGRDHRFLLSTCHPFRNGHYVGGGPFITVKTESHIGVSGATVVFRPSWGKAYVGGFTIGAPDKVGPNLGDAYTQNAFASLESLGASAWNALRPDKPDFSLALSVAELKDPLESLKHSVHGMMSKVKKAQMKRAKQGKSPLSKTGSYFLAISFGWLPILSDVRNYVKAHKNAQKRLRQLIRDNGKPITRTRELSKTENHNGGSTTTYASGYGAALNPSFVTQCYATGPTFRRTHTSDHSRTWCEGTFRYHLPPGPKDVDWQVGMLRRIMGGRPTPDLIYNLMPWTWLADYFTGLGDFIQAISPGVADRLAADGAWLMRSEEWTATTDASGCFQGDYKNNAVKNTVTCSSSTTTIRKMRSVASPFGWGVKQSSLSPMQSAILAALGASKLG